jgi:hypothetical protein
VRACVRVYEARLCASRFIIIIIIKFKFNFRNLFEYKNVLKVIVTERSCPFQAIKEYGGEGVEDCVHSFLVSGIGGSLLTLNGLKPQCSLYVPPGLTFNNPTFCAHSVFMCFVWISEQTAIISLYSIN